MGLEIIGRLLALSPLEASAVTSAADAVSVRRFETQSHHDKARFNLAGLKEHLEEHLFKAIGPL